MSHLTIIPAYNKSAKNEVYLWLPGPACDSKTIVPQIYADEKNYLHVN